MRTNRLATFVCVFLVLVSGVLGLAWYKKTTLVEYVALQQAANYGLTLDGLELAFTPEQNLDIKSVCFSHALITGCARNVMIEWQWPSLKAVIINRISVEHAELSMPNKIIVPSSPLSSSNNDYFANTLNPLQALLTSVELPFAVHIYNAQVATPYLTKPLRFSVLWDNTHKKLNLASAEPNPAFELNVARTDNLLSGRVRFNVTHTLNVISPTFNLATQLPNLHTIKGDAQLNWTWQQDSIDIDATLNDTQITYQIPHVGLTSLSSTATNDMALSVTKKTINAQFARPLQLNLTLLEPNWAKWLANTDLSPQLQTLIAEHASPTLVLSSLSQARFNVNTQTLTLDALDANWSTFNLKTKDILLSPETQLLAGTAHGQLNLTSLEPRLTSPVLIDMELDVTKSAQQTRINIEQLNASTDVWNDKTFSAQTIRLQTSGLADINKEGKISSKVDYQLDVAAFKHEVSTLRHLHASGALSSDHLQYKTKGVLAINHAQANRQQLGAFTLVGDLAQAKLDYNLAKAPIPALKNLVQLPALKPLKLSSGTLNLALTSHFDVKTATLEKANVTFSVRDLSGVYNETPWQTLSYFDELYYSDGVWQSVLPEQANLIIASLTKSGAFKDFSTHFSVQYDNQQPRFTLNDTTLYAFGGQLQADHITWPVTAAQQVAVDVSKLDLTQLLSLQKSDEIVVEGYISGILPLTLTTNTLGKPQVSIKDGLLSNVGPALIRVKDNPAVKDLKTQQANLKLAFEALEHLQVNTLSAKVDMQPNGAMQLDTKIKGHNPDIDNDVNFNLNLNYDLPGLIQSLLIADQLENNLTKPIRPKESK